MKLHLKITKPEVLGNKTTQNILKHDTHEQFI